MRIERRLCVRAGLIDLRWTCHPFGKSGNHLLDRIEPQMRRRSEVFARSGHLVHFRSPAADSSLCQFDDKLPGPARSRPVLTYASDRLTECISDWFPARTGADSLKSVARRSTHVAGTDASPRSRLIGWRHGRGATGERQAGRTPPQNVILRRRWPYAEWGQPAFPSRFPAAGTETQPHFVMGESRGWCS